MYCVKCGVELADSEKKCPLCGTPVFHPDILLSFPILRFAVECDPVIFPVPPDRNIIS